MSESTSALVIAAHGSHLNPDSDTPVFNHADTIRGLEVFDEVREAFWKEEPSFREVLRTLTSDIVYVVPLFMSEGYFTDQVIPRELRITDDQELDVNKTVRYTDPVGTHPSLTDVIIDRAESITNNPEVGDGYGLAIVGHGTERHENSAQSTIDHAERIRKQDRFDQTLALFMDEAPYIDNVTDHFSTPNVIIVPLFIANGYHTREDIPEDIGITDDYRDGFDVPSSVGNQQIWYSGAVGTQPEIADILLERATEAGAISKPSKNPI